MLMIETEFDCNTISSVQNLYRWKILKSRNVQCWLLLSIEWSIDQFSVNLISFAFCYERTEYSISFTFKHCNGISSINEMKRLQWMSFESSIERNRKLYSFDCIKYNIICPLIFLSLTTSLSLSLSLSVLIHLRAEHCKWMVKLMKLHEYHSKSRTLRTSIQVMAFLECTLHRSCCNVAI